MNDYVMNIPEAMRQLPQWIVCSTDVVKSKDKLPFDPKNGMMASSTDPSTWSDFETACAARTPGRPHVAFVLTKNDPFTIIDLDDPYDPKKVRTPDQQDKLNKLNSDICAAFNSYQEISQSGRGVHIVVTGSIPKGVNRDTVELYYEGRYMIMTGNVINASPVQDYQPQLSAMFMQMEQEGVQIELDENGSEPLSDLEVFEMAAYADNSNKFLKLVQGDWESDYASQSEADLALISMFCFYTRNNEQVRRLFRDTPLGKREKAVKNNKYLDYCIKRFRAQQIPEIDLDNLRTLPTPAREPEPAPAPAAPVPTQATGIYPPGLIGEVAAYIEASAIRPVPEIALAASLSLFAGITGRQYNISGTGLNMYVVLLAETGSGKEGGTSGIDNLISYVSQKVPNVDKFIGPGDFASGQGLLRTLDDQQSFVSILGEFGHKLKEMCHPNASSAVHKMKTLLLDLYNKSGWNKVLRPSAYSDKEKNTLSVHAPNVSIYGESAPSSFFDGITSQHIEDGLLPRFFLLPYEGLRPAKNENAFCPPTQDLVNRLSDVVTQVMQMERDAQCANIPCNSEALAILDKFDIECDDHINNPNASISRHLWNRGHLKALKLSGLLAVGVNYYQPMVTKELAEWAIHFVKQDIRYIEAKFESGEMGSDDSQMFYELKRIVEKWLEMTPEQRLKTQKASAKIAEYPVIPHKYLAYKFRQTAVFKNHKLGASRGGEEALKQMIDGGLLVEVTRAQATDKFSSTAKLYALGSEWG